MWRIILVTALSLSVVPLVAGAQPACPTKPVELVVGFSPGGGADVAARLIAAYASRKWGQPVNVVNMPGASGITATLQVLNARPDGYTLFADVHAVASMLFAVQSDVPFKTWMRGDAVIDC